MSSGNPKYKKSSFVGGMGSTEVITVSHLTVAPLGKSGAYVLLAAGTYCSIANVGTGSVGSAPGGIPLGRGRTIWYPQGAGSVSILTLIHLP